MTDPAIIAARVEQIEADLRAIQEIVKNGIESALSPEKAAKILGWPIGKGRGYTRRLKFARDAGHLTIFYNHRPFMYDREEVLALAEKIRAGKVYIPGF